MKSMKKSTLKITAVLLLFITLVGNTMPVQAAVLSVNTQEITIGEAGSGIVTPMAAINIYRVEHRYYENLSDIPENIIAYYYDGVVRFTGRLYLANIVRATPGYVATYDGYLSGSGL